MEEYLKDSNETRSLEQKVYELDIQRYKFIIENYKKQLEQIYQSREEYENQNENITEDIKRLKDQLQDAESQKTNISKDLEKVTKQFSIHEKKLTEEIENLKNKIKKLKRKTEEDESEMIKTLRNRIKELEESKDDKKKRGKTFDDYKERCKTLEKEINQLRVENKKKEDEWFESIVSQNTKLLEKFEKFDSFNLILKEITNLGKHIKQQENRDDSNFKNTIKEIMEAYICKGDNFKDKTIRTLKATNELKSKIIKKQEEKIAKKKTISEKNVHDLSNESVIKPEENETSIVFGIENQLDSKIAKVIKEPSPKKTKMSSFDEAVLKASKPKKDNKKTISTKKDQSKSGMSKINIASAPIIKKPHLPSDAPKLNNASFFANITFTDSSPVLKKDQKK